MQSMKLHSYPTTCTVPEGKSLDKRDVPVAFFFEMPLPLDKRDVGCCWVSSPSLTKGGGLAEDPINQKAKNEIS